MTNHSIIPTGPDLPTAIKDHSMVSLGFGQAILGGEDNSGIHQTKIYYISCYLQICKISTLNQQLSVGRSGFVAIPIPDTISGCISHSKFLWFWPHSMWKMN